MALNSESSSSSDDDRDIKAEKKRDKYYKERCDRKETV